MIADVIKIHLSAAKVRYAERFGRGRGTVNRAAGQPDARISPRHTSVEIDLLGIVGEFAVFLVIRRFWRGLKWTGALKNYEIWKDWRHNNCDVGIVEVKSVDQKHLGLMVRNSGVKETAPYVLAIVTRNLDGSADVILAGWAWGHRVLDNYVMGTKYAKAGFLIAQDELSGMSGLIALIKAHANRVNQPMQV